MKKLSFLMVFLFMTGILLAQDPQPCITTKNTRVDGGAAAIGCGADYNGRFTINFKQAVTTANIPTSIAVTPNSYGPFTAKSTAGIIFENPVISNNGKSISYCYKGGSLTNGDHKYTVELVYGTEGCGDKVDDPDPVCPTIATPNISVTPVCGSGMVSMTANTSMTLVWMDDQFADLLDQPVPSNAFSPNLNHSTVYNVYAKDQDGCQSASIAVTARVNPLPVVTCPDDRSVCANAADFELSGGSAGGTYSGTGVRNGRFYPADVVVGTHVITKTFTDEKGCSNSCSFIITVNPAPNSSAQSNPRICAGSNLDLTSGGGTTYSWTGPNNFSSQSQNPSIPAATSDATGMYQVMVTDGNGCSASASTAVRVYAPLSGVSAGSNLNYAGAPLNLTALYSGGDIASFSWNTNGSGVFNSAGSNPTSYTPGASDFMVNSTKNITITLIITPEDGVCAARTSSVVVTTRLGNPCNGLTLGFWSNANGETRFRSCNAGVASNTTSTTNIGPMMTAIKGLNPRAGTVTTWGANGTLANFNNYSGYKAWSLAANATNMANMLSAQLIAMHLNVNCGGASNVNRNALIFAPGTNSANSVTGLATVEAVMNEAIAILSHAGTLIIPDDGSALRRRATAVKDALDHANNNRNFLPNCAVTPTTVAGASNASLRVAEGAAELSVNGLKVAAYPNPFTTRLSLNIKTPLSGMATIQFYSVNGALLTEMKQFVQADVNNIVEVRTDRFKSNIIYRVSVGDHKANGMVLNK